MLNPKLSAIQKEACKKRPQTFKPGNSGHPEGHYTREYSVSACIRELIKYKPEKVIESWKTNMTGARRIAIATFAKAQKGELTAANMVMDRTEGRPTQVIEHSGKDGAPIRMDVKHLTDEELERIAGRGG